jgi:signal transduction histidine kinase/HPt (histidine-containing phosphotransfer) domain-containing protein
MNSPLRIVYLEDDPADVRLVRDTFEDDGMCPELTAVDNRADFLAALEQGPDVVLADYALPTFDGMEALALCRALYPERPFIFVTGAVGEERAIETLKSGATDYVLKTRLSRLGMAVRRAVAEADDVAARKRALEQLNAAKAAAESANLAKSRFLANISHELRTPMNAILGMIDIALPKVSDAVVQDCLQTAKESADLLLTLLNDLLDSAKIESGKLDLESAPFSLRKMLDQMSRVFAMRANEKGLTFRCHVQDVVPDLLMGDRLRLQQVLFNLAGNAVKFTEAGGVEIGVRCRSRDRAACLEFEVRDTGIGIPPDHLDQLFQPFVQGDASMARRFGGSGLGLSICKSLVQLMDGDIRVESAPRAGTVFFFTVCLPLAEGLHGDAQRAAATAADTCAPLHVLLVEDNIANQKLANYILRERGHRVDIADDGKEAVRITEQIQYDVVLMDVQMPVMNGLDAAAAIRDREKDGRRVPIIAMTAHATPSDRDRCMAAGMDGYLCKPVRRDELIAAVEQLGAAGKRGGPAAEPPSAHQAACSPRTNSCPQTPDNSPINLDQALARLDGKFELFQEMVGYFYSDGLELLPEIRSAAERGDAATMANKAHRFKGTVLYLGAAAATMALDRIESLGRLGDVAGASLAVEAMEAEVARLAAALQRFRPDTAGSAAGNELPAPPPA